MSREINFVQSRRKQLTKNQENDLKIFKISGAVFGVLVVVFVIALGINFYLQFRIKGIKDQEKKMETQILSNGLIEQSILVTTEKLKILAELFDQRYDKQAAIEYFSNIFGPEVLIKNINYAADEKILSLRVQATSIFILEQVFAQLSNPEVEQKFGIINKSELIRNDRGRYSMAITLSLDEEAAKTTTTKKK